MTSVIDFCGIFPLMQDRPVFSSCVSTEWPVVIEEACRAACFLNAFPWLLLFFKNLAFHILLPFLVGLCHNASSPFRWSVFELCVCIMLKLKVSQSLNAFTSLVWSSCIIAELLVHLAQFMVSFYWSASVLFVIVLVVGVLFDLHGRSCRSMQWSVVSVSLAVQPFNFLRYKA